MNRSCKRAEKLVLVTLFAIVGLTAAHADEFVQVAAQVHATGRVNVAALGAGAPRGATELDGNITANFVSGTAAHVTVTIPLVENINSTKLTVYTIGEPADCQGIKFTLDQQFIQVHEDIHRSQIEHEVNAKLAGLVWYQASTKTFKVGGTVGPNAALQPKIATIVKDVISDLAAEDAKDYDDHNFKSGLEGDARAASCRDFMARFGNQLLQYVMQAEAHKSAAVATALRAETALAAANTAATQAKQAADAALAAGNACDRAEFSKQQDAFQKASQQLSDQIAALTLAISSVRAERTQAIAAADHYDGFKAAHTIQLFPRGDDPIRGVRSDLGQTFQMRVANLDTGSMQAQQKGADAAQTMIAAIAAVAKCSAEICPAKDQRTVLSNERICRSGFWQFVRLKRMICPDGRVVSEDVVSDKMTKIPCKPPAGGAEQDKPH